MISERLSALVLSITLFCCANSPIVNAASLEQAEPERNRIHVLFLGDNGHHRPADRARVLLPAFAEKGIAVTYTDQLSDLNSENLARYDVLMIYANHPVISPDQERALLDFVAMGGGLVPIHSASSCFRNSEAYIRLVGGAFKSHGSGVFSTPVVMPDHPAIQGLPAFESWDETYVHQKLHPEIEVLAVRMEGDREEPWTWVRRHGEGRVFYTAWGHDERTWTNPAFHELLERGVRWTAGDWALDWRYDVAPFEYTRAEVPLPFYPAGERWGTTGDPVEEIPEALLPEESMKHMVLPPGFSIELFASEPDIVNPIDMAWDERGRLWIAETVDYPNRVLEEDGVGNDRITILEDTTGDGRADKISLFAENLNIPTGLVFANGGLIVSQAPHLLLLKDTTGDGKADVREILSTGWGTFDTHAGPSNLRYGLDNQIWGSVGYAGFQGEVGGESHTFAQGFFRIAADGSSLEYLTTTSNNTWGLGFSEEGYVFGSTANGNPSVFMHIPNPYYDSVSGWSGETLAMISDKPDIFPVATEVRQVDHHGRYTSAAGHEIYTARVFPRSYWNRVAFVAEPTGHLLGKFVIEPDGAGFRTRNAWNMLASRDEWTSPIVARVGPDGMLWVIDWYNIVIQHNPTPPGFETGPGNAYETPVRDRRHARIYRIVYDGAARERRAFTLADATLDELVLALRDDNMFWRTTAQRLLVERGERDVLPALYNLVRDEWLDEIGSNPGALHALWTMHGLGVLEGSDSEALTVATGALNHPAAAVRRAATMVLPRTDAALDAMFTAGILPDRQSPEGTDYIMPTGYLMDADPQVRLAALLALSEFPVSERAGRAAADMLVEEPNGRDRWLAHGATIAGAKHGEFFLAGVLHEAAGSEDTTYVNHVSTAVQRTARHYAANGGSQAVASILETLRTSFRAYGDALLQGFTAGWPEERPPSLTEQEEVALADLARALPADQAEQLRVLTERWGKPHIVETR